MTPIQKDPQRGLNGALAAEIRGELAVQQRKQVWLAEKSGIERVTLGRYLNGERAINTAVAEAIAEALGIDAADLMLRAVARRDASPSEYGLLSEETPSLRAVAKKGRREEPGEDSI